MGVLTPISTSLPPNFRGEADDPNAYFVVIVTSFVSPWCTVQAPYLLTWRMLSSLQIRDPITGDVSTLQVTLCQLFAAQLDTPLSYVTSDWADTPMR